MLPENSIRIERVGYLLAVWALAVWLGLTLMPAHAAVATAPNGAHTDGLNLTPEVEAALDDFYMLDYAEAQSGFEKVAAENPTDPMALDYVLYNTVVRELYRLDLLDTTWYVHDGFLSGRHPVTEDLRVRARVDALYNRAIQLSNQRLQADPKDVDALFARGFATSMQTMYTGMVEKRYGPALRLALAARNDNDAVLRLDPKYADAYLSVGVHEYIVGSLSLPFKLLIGIVGIHGSRSKGIEDLRHAGQDGTINSVPARTALALFLRREAKYPQAFQVIDGLRRQCPRSFLFTLEQANLLKDSGQGLPSIAAYHALIAQAGTPGYYPNAHLELAYYGLGEAARGQRRIAEAANAYESAAEQPTASPLMKRRAYLAAGEMFDLLHQQAKANQQFAAVVALGNDSSQAASARKFEQVPYSDN